jgi:hypothetical protein
MPAKLAPYKPSIKPVHSAVDAKPRTKRVAYTENGSPYAFSTPPPTFANLDLTLFNTNLSAFLQSWIPETFAIFNPTGAAVSTRGFWASQMRSDLYHLLWQPRYLGREVTEDELDWIVEAALGREWGRIESMALGREGEERAGSMSLGPEERTSSVSARYSRGRMGRTKLRRAVVLGDLMAGLSIDDGACQGSKDEGLEESDDGCEERETAQERRRETINRKTERMWVREIMVDAEDWSESKAVSDVAVAKVKVRPAQAGALLKKTLRNI